MVKDAPVLALPSKDAGAAGIATATAAPAAAGCAAGTAAATAAAAATALVGSLTALSISICAAKEV